jgi:hypothetical protein
VHLEFLSSCCRTESMILESRHLHSGPGAECMINLAATQFWSTDGSSRGIRTIK